MAESMQHKDHVGTREHGYLTDLFKELHRHPEVAFEEEWTTARLRRELESIEGVELLDIGLPTGLLARIVGRPDGPVVGLRSDIDALPITEESGADYASQIEGKMHACGHDFHMTSLIGAAHLLAAQRDRLSGTVVLLFQPGEESSFGAKRVLEAGQIQKFHPQWFFAQHVAPDLEPGQVAVLDGAATADVDRFRIVVHGKGGHGAAPSTTRDPVVASAGLIISVQEIVSRVAPPFQPVVLSVTHIEAGSTWNIIPDDAIMEGTSRTFDRKMRATVEREVRLRALALDEEGYHVDVEWTHGNDSVINDPELANLAREVAETQGLAVTQRMPRMSGEDFSELAAISRILLINTGVGCDELHTPTFKANLDALDGAVGLLAGVARRALETLSAQG